MFDVSRCNALLASVDGYRSMITQYDDSAAMLRREKEEAIVRPDRFMGITAATLPTRTAAANAFLYNDRRRSPSDNGGANTALTGPMSTVRQEGLSALPSRLHPLLIRGGTYEAAVASVVAADEAATREARLAASLSKVPATVISEYFWGEVTIRLSQLLKMPKKTAAATTKNVKTHAEDADGFISFGAEGITFGGSDDDDDAHDDDTETQNAAHTSSSSVTMLPHQTSHSLMETVTAVLDELKSIEKLVDDLKDEAVNGIVYCSTDAEVNALQRRLAGELADLEGYTRQFAALTGLATIDELHRMRVIGTYMLSLGEMEAWLKGMATIHHDKDRVLDPFEKAVLDDCVLEERAWASSAENAHAPLEEFQIRTKIIADLRQSEQEHRQKKVDKLSDIDPGFLLHTSKQNLSSATTSRRFQMLQHIARQALRLRSCANSPSHSAGQQAKAEKVSSYVLGWIAEITENHTLKEELRHDTRSQSNDHRGGRVGLLSATASTMPATRSGLLSASSYMSTSSRANERNLARFISSGDVDRVDIVSRVTTEEMGDQLARVLLALKETSVGADVVLRRNELDSIRDYIFSSIHHPTLSQVIDTAELQRILADLSEWEAANPDGTTAEGYIQLIEVLRDAASKCGLSVLADHESAAYEKELTTKTPSVGLIPSAEEDRSVHSRRPPSSVALFRQFSAQQEEKAQQQRVAPIFDAISDCCDIIEAVQQLRVHVRIRGRAHVPASFLTDKVEPLQNELKALLVLLEAEGEAKMSRHKRKQQRLSLEKNALVIASPPGEGLAREGEEMPAIVTTSAAVEEEGPNEDLAKPADDANVEEKAEEPTPLNEGEIDEPKCPEASTEGSAAESVEKEEKAPQDDNADEDSANEDHNPLIIRLGAAADVALSLLKEARHAYGVTVPSSCFILAHAV